MKLASQPFADTRMGLKLQRVAGLSAGIVLSMSAIAQQPTSGQSASAALAPVRVVLAPAVETTVVSQMPGQLVNLNASLGSKVVRGREVVRFDCNEQNARLKMGEAELSGAEQSLEAKLRLQGLQQATDTEVALAASAVDRARAQSDVYKAQLAHCSVFAPFSGRVVKMHVRPFQGVVAGQPLMDLVSDGTLKVRMNVPSIWLQWLKRGSTFDVAIEETGQRYKARVQAINGRVDPVSQTVEIEGQLTTKPTELLAGMSGNAYFDAPQQ
jgi:RND family efflux transporter MFP subunit